MRISDWSSDVCSSDLDALRLGHLARHRGDFGREEEHFGVAARELDAELADIGFAPAEARRQRQRHRPGAGIDENGRASCRERGCREVKILVVAVTLKKRTDERHINNKYNRKQL